MNFEQFLTEISPYLKRIIRNFEKSINKIIRHITSDVFNKLCLKLASLKLLSNRETP